MLMPPIHMQIFRKARAERKDGHFGYHAHYKAGSGVDLGKGVSLDIGVGAEERDKISSDHIDINVGVGAGFGANAYGVPVIGVGITSGLGVRAGINREEVNLGGSLLTPVGTFGAHVGCTFKICFIGCLTIGFCPSLLRKEG